LNETIAKFLKNWTNIRRDFHQYPEVGFNLNRTHLKLKELLTKMGAVKVVAKVGLILDINGNILVKIYLMTYST
jgi:metal-dependent amidase/aminoacylase/carboxypeptidase family protein